MQEDITHLMGNNQNIMTMRFEDEEQLMVGNKIIFYKDKEFIHEIIEKGYDRKGFYVITRDNHNNFQNGKARQEDINKIVIGVIS